MEKTDPLVCLEFLEKWVPVVSLVQEDLTVFLVPLVFLALRGLLVQKEMRDPQVPPDHQVLLVTKVRWDHQDQLGHLDPLVKPDQEESQAFQDCQEQMGFLERMETLENLVQRVTRVPRVTLDPLVFQAPEESKETLVNVELKETKVKKERLDWRGRRETWA